MQVFDASSMIYAWDNYPIGQFPSLWKWIAVQIIEKKLVMPSVAFAEVQSKTPDCGAWLKTKNLEQLGITNSIMQDAMFIKGLLGIKGDNYHSRGVGENDILIVAVARAHKGELVSEEERQPTPPKEPSKKKIPAVCGMRDVTVPCINFIEYLKRSGEVFH
jgi:hypothetical protein